MPGGSSVETENNLAAACDRVRHQFAGKLVDLRIRQADSEWGCYQAEGMNSAADLFTAPAYSVGCLESVFEGILAALLCADGTLEAGALIGEYLPELNWSDEGSPGRNVRLRDLLSHATGYHAPSHEGPFGLVEATSYLRSSRPAFPPGRVCSWNVMGRSLLVPLLERVTGDRLYKVVRSRLYDMSGVELSVVNEESVSPSFLVTLQELIKILSSAFGPDGVSDLPSRLAADAVPVVRRPVSARCGYPIAYSWNMGLYGDGLWGHSGNGPRHTIGVRYSTDFDFVTALSIGAPSFARDLALQYLAAVGGRDRPEAAAGAIGALVDCPLEKLEGKYFADGDDCVSVRVLGDGIICDVSRGEEVITSIPMRLVDDNLLVSDGRWSALQIEFFTHPETGKPCLVLGQVTYCRKND